jgi:hypothetical protein
VKFTWNWKWALTLGIVALLILTYEFRPDLIQKWVHSVGADKRESHPRSEKVSQAELLGKIDKALLYAAEVKERLSAYRSQFDGPEGELLDSLFFDGELSNHYLRPTWWELRRELPEFVRKHDALISALHKAKAEVTKGDLTTWADLPDESEEASKALDTAIQERNRKLPKFGALAKQMKRQVRKGN